MKRKLILLLFLIQYLPTIKTAAFVSTFGDQIVATRNDQVSLMFQYNVPTDLLNILAAGSGTINQTQGHLQINTGTDSNGSMTATSKTSLHYSPGHEGSVFFTAAYTTGVADSQQFIGLIDDNDGWAVGYNGVNFAILFRRFSGSNTYINQANFNVDPLNGTGPSGFTIDQTKINVFRISYGWLGVAPVTFQVLKPDGTWIVFHRIEYPNSETTPHIENPTLPIRAFVTNSGNTSDLQLRTVCWNASIVGEDTFLRQFIAGTENVLIDSTSDLPIFTIRNKTTFPPADPQANKTAVRIILGLFGVEQNRTMLCQYKKNATLTGAVYSDVNSTESVVEVDTSASAVSGGTVVYATPVIRASLKNIVFKRNLWSIELQPGESLTVTGRKLEGNVRTNMFIQWEEVI